ncbi:MAG: hypothetical protein N2560_01250 [Ignavibacteria bacterium]|nr:hypothetical protein [Ignavibacteria bacterium]
MAKEKEEISTERKKALKEKEKVKKEQEARLRKRLKAERKKLDRIVTFPYKSLFIIGSVLGIVFLLYNYYIERNTLLGSIFKGFILFVIVYFGLGILFLIWFLILAKVRQKEAEEKRRLEEEMARERERAALEGKLERDLLLKEAQEKREAELRKLREQLENE